MANSKVTSKNIIETVTQIAKPIAKNLNLEIWNVEFVKEGPNWYLRVFIDSDTGITLQDCENMSRALNKPLDETDPIPTSYCLEVCSPGIERELSTDKHFTKFLNDEIKIRLIRPNENNKKELLGKLQDFNKTSITILNEENNSLTILKKDIAHINLNY